MPSRETGLNWLSMGISKTRSCLILYLCECKLGQDPGLPRCVSMRLEAYFETGSALNEIFFQLRFAGLDGQDDRLCLLSPEPCPLHQHRPAPQPLLLCQPRNQKPGKTCSEIRYAPKFALILLAQIFKSFFTRNLPHMHVRQLIQLSLVLCTISAAS